MTDQPEQTPLTAPRILLMGGGSSGARTVESVAAATPGLNRVVIDTDQKELESLRPEKIIHIGEAVTNGFSAGGDVELGRQSIEKSSAAIRSKLRPIDLLIIVAGLGGGTGSGAVPVITRLARETETLVLCLVTMPFAFEGQAIAGKAAEALKRIRTHADAIVRISNEMLVDRPDADLPLEDAFARSRKVATEGVAALWRMLSQTGVCGLDFACIHTMLRNCDGFCHFAAAETAGANRGPALAEEISTHRLLNNGKMLGRAAGIVVGITGGNDLRLSEVEQVMNQIQEKLPEDTWVNFGVVVDPAFDNRLSALVMVAEQWKEPLVDAANRQMGFTYNRRLSLEQGELPLEAAGKGRFTNLDPTIHNNQDLDVPTYLRRSIKLPR